MRRLIDWPRGLKWVSRVPLSGPRSVGAGQTESVAAFVQTVGSPFGLHRYQFSFGNLRGETFRRYRGLVTALHGGANAVRVPFCDPDGMGWPQLGVTLDRPAHQGAPWSNGLGWQNGQPWQVGRPVVPLISAGLSGNDSLWMAGTYWGAKLGIGDMIGISPFHFGLYYITEVYQPGYYRIWPPLRKDVTTSDMATLTPVLAMRLESENSASAGRGATSGENLTMTLVEVSDDDLRDYFYANP